MADEQKHAQKETRRAIAEVLDVGDPGGGSGGGGRGRGGDHRKPPQKWGRALRDYCARLTALEVRWRRGASSYHKWLTFDIPSTPAERSKWTGTEIEAWSEETLAVLWGRVVDYTESNGPVLDFQLRGLGVAKPGGVAPLVFELAARCNVTEGGAGDGFDDPENPERDAVATVRELRGMFRELHTSTQKLLESTIQPLHAIGELQTRAVGAAAQTIEWTRRLAREELATELARVQDTISERRWGTLERLSNRAMDVLGGDLADAAAQWFRAWGEAPIPPDLRKISAELAAMHTYQQAASLPDEVADELFSLWNNAEQHATEEACALAWAAHHESLKRHLPRYLELGSGRQRRLFAKARARVTLHDRAVPEGGIPW